MNTVTISLEEYTAQKNKADMNQKEIDEKAKSLIEAWKKEHRDWNSVAFRGFIAGAIVGFIFMYVIHL